MRRLKAIVPAMAAFLIPLGVLHAEIIVPGADGSDLNFAPTANIQIDLSNAVPRAWNEPSPQPRSGVYDHEKWAIVFKYSSVNIPAGVTVTFKNHPSRAPVVWLVQGQVRIDGTINLNGATGHGDTVRTFASPGPGGFRGGRGSDASSRGAAGLGPGGSDLGDDNSRGSGASYGWGGTIGDEGGGAAGRTYGNAGILPLIGGSGGAGGTNWDDGSGGGGGGGAILIATESAAILNGNIQAYGGRGGDNCNAGGPGSAGAIRIIADSISGSGKLLAPTTDRRSTCGYNSGYGGGGRVRIEANSATLSDQGTLQYWVGSPGPTAILWPEDLGLAPSLRIKSIGGLQVGTDPRAALSFPGADLALPTRGNQLVIIEGENVPLDWSVYLRLVPTTGFQTVVPAAFAGGDAGQSTWHASVSMASGFSVMQARTVRPATTATASEDENTENIDDDSTSEQTTPSEPE